ncbi:MAG TPA: AAA family ATPase [Nocardioidaceae bacterium]|nr:AAA family ATPase [Nocardioidaceae bacterium]
MAVAQRGRPADLVGRGRELRALDDVLDAPRAGHSAVLLVRGESGSGKTALLDHLEAQASGFRVVRITGVQSEMELAFASLHQLCLPLLDFADQLPEPQKTALHSAFGMSRGGPPQRFLVALATLNLLALAAEDRPLVCLVDDMQWIDQASVQTLTFVTRRLLAEPIAVVFAVRGLHNETALPGLPEMVLQPLEDRAARHLLASTLPRRLDPQVGDRIIAEARGNPLALLELSRATSKAGLAGGFEVPGALPMQSRLEATFVRRLEMLPGHLQKLLLVAAAEPVGDVTLLSRATENLGIADEATSAVEIAVFLEVGSRVRFAHPLVRSAAYRMASPTERRAAHGALAAATDPDVDPDRCAWHRAKAVAGLDDAVADELERSAGRAQARGGVAAAAAFLVRATELTSDPSRRCERAIDAAEAKFASGALDAAEELVALADEGPLDTRQRALLSRLRAQLTLARQRGVEAPPLFLDAARRLAGVDPELSRETYLDAFGAALYVGRLGGGRVGADVAAAARDAPGSPDPPRALDLLLDALVVRFTEGAAAGARPLQEAVWAYRDSDAGREEHLPGTSLACRAAAAIWDDDSWHALTTRDVGLAREAGALAILPIADTYRAGVHVHAGEFSEAAVLISEAEAITRATGAPPLMYTALVLAAWRGHEAEVLDMVREALPAATERGEGRVVALIDYATAVLYNALGRYPEAMAAARAGCDFDDLGLSAWSLTELVEASARSGDLEAATAALQQLRSCTRACDTHWSRGIEARSAALVSDSDDAESKYRDAVEHLTRSRISVHAARAHLLYGEWLRREKRRSEARDQLRQAHTMFRQMGAAAFAERARRELLATGEKVRKRTGDAGIQLTTREAQIARLANEGFSNPEIGTRLFLSPRTVEYHLRKVFMKADITSRTELSRALGGAQGPPLPDDPAQP